MAREIPGLNTLLNILAQNRAQERADVQFDRQMGFRERQADVTQENFLQQLGIEMEQLGMSKRQLEASLESQELQRQINELLLAERRDPENKPSAEAYRRIYERLVPGVDPTKIDDGVPKFSATDTSWLDKLLTAQRTQPVEPPTPTAAILNAFDLMTRIRDEWNDINPASRQQYGSFEAYRQERLPELIGPYNFLAPMFGLDPITLDGGGSDVQGPPPATNLNTPEWRAKSSARAQAITDLITGKQPGSLEEQYFGTIGRGTLGALGAGEKLGNWYLNLIGGNR